MPAHEALTDALNSTSGSRGRTLRLAILFSALAILSIGGGCAGTQKPNSADASASSDSPEARANSKDDTTERGTSTEQQRTGPVVEDGPIAFQLPAGFSQPERTLETISTDIGTIEGTVFKSMDPTSETLCLIMYNEYPPVVFDTQTTEEVLAGARDGALDEGGLELVSQKPVETRDGHAVKAYVGKRKIKDDTFYFRMEVHAVRPYLVQVQYATNNKSRLHDADVNAYFDSLRIDASSASEKRAPSSQGD